MRAFRFQSGPYIGASYTHERLLRREQLLTNILVGRVVVPSAPMSGTWMSLTNHEQIAAARIIVEDGLR